MPLPMIGMPFMAFLVILVAGIIAALVLHYAVGYRFLRGSQGLVAKWIAGWIGAWLGSPVLGHWWFQIEGIYAIPAIIGAFVGAFCVVAFWKSLSQANTGSGAATPIGTSRAA